MDRAEPVEGVEVGEIIGGYRLERLLGAGSVSRVFLGTHVRLGRRAAIKVLLTPLADDAMVMQRFLNEARVVNDIRHPNIVDVNDFIESESPRRLALVMEHIEGPSLKTLARQGYRLSFVQAVSVALQLCAAVEAAHQAGVIHRDLKPDNLLLTSDPTQDPRALPGLKVVDFGIAKIAGPGEKTATGMMIGTPAYMAPEQIAGKPPPSPATDVFAVGEVLYELLTGKRAYPASQINALIQAKLKGELPRLEVLEVPGGVALKAMIERCLAARPQDRPRLAEIKALLLELCPEASGPGRPEEDTQEPPEPSITQPMKLAIPAISTSPTLQPEPATLIYPPASPMASMSAALRPTPYPIRTPIFAAAVACLVALAIWSVWPKDQVQQPAAPVRVERPIAAEPIVAVPRAVSGGFQLITQPDGAQVEELATGRLLGQTPLAVEHNLRVRISKEGYRTEELALPAFGKNMTVELTKNIAPTSPPPAPAKKKEKNPWDW